MTTNRKGLTLVEMMIGGFCGLLLFGGLAFRYLSRRAATPLTGITSLKKLMTILRLAPSHGFRARRPGRAILRRRR